MPKPERFIDKALKAQQNPANNPQLLIKLSMFRLLLESVKYANEYSIENLTTVIPEGSSLVTDPRAFPDLINEIDEKDNTPLGNAILANNQQAFDYLKRNEATLENVSEEKKNEILIHCIGHGYEKMVDYLIESKVSLTKKGKHGWSPLMVAIYYDRPEIFEKIINHPTIDIKNFSQFEKFFLMLLSAFRGIFTGKYDMYQKLSEKFSIK
jgi:Ankyrin repeats (3 copies)